MNYVMEKVSIDLSGLREIAGDDDSFVAMLLGKMVKQLPLSFSEMEQSKNEANWETLRSASHKAKSTFAYLGLDEMKNHLRDIEHNVMDNIDLDQLPKMVNETLLKGNVILDLLKVELAKLS